MNEVVVNVAVWLVLTIAITVTAFFVGRHHAMKKRARTQLLRVGDQWVAIPYDPPEVDSE